MNVRSRLALSSVLGLALAAAAFSPACKKKEKPKADAGTAAKPVEVVKPVAVGAGAVSNKCVGTLTMAGAPRELTLNGKKWRQHGYELVALEKDANDGALLGLVADVKDATPETLANLRHFVAEFKKRGVDAIVLAGDVAEEAPDMKTVLALLADSGLPTFVIIGNIESLKDYDAAIAAVSATRPNLFDLNKIRFVAGDDYDLLSLPGYHDPSHVRSKEGCAYTAEDVKDLNKLISRSTQGLVLVSHGPPRGTTNTSLDVLNEKDGHVGDEKMAAFIRAANVPFGVFSNVMEQGGNGVVGDFNTRIGPNTPVDKLYVNVGRAAASPWTLASGEVSTGMAMLLKLEGKKGSYEVLKAPAAKAGTPAPKKGAAPGKPAPAPAKAAPAPAPAPAK